MIRTSIVLALFTSVLMGAGPDPAKKVWRNPKDGMEFVWIPAGSLAVEAAATQPGSQPVPALRVPIKEGFWMGRTEVTVAQFRRFVRETGHLSEAEKDGSKVTWRAPGFKQADNHPAVYISRKDAVSYAEWAGVDLPTEPEWLYACRAGTGTRYYWGDDVDDRYVWHRGNSPLGTHPVGRTLPNRRGLYDMVGNAWEWCKPLKDDGTACDVMAVPRGASWTRCPRYMTRQGYEFTSGLSEAVAPPLAKCDANARMYPWDDDRGFRCVRR